MPPDVWQPSADGTLRQVGKHAACCGMGGGGGGGGGGGSASCDDATGPWHPATEWRRCPHAPAPQGPCLRPCPRPPLNNQVFYTNGWEDCSVLKPYWWNHILKSSYEVQGIIGIELGDLTYHRNHQHTRIPGAPPLKTRDIDELQLGRRGRGKVACCQAT